MGIDGRFARRGQLGDIVDAGTPKAFLEEELLGCIENSSLDVAGKVRGGLPRFGLLFFAITIS